MRLTLCELTFWEAINLARIQKKSQVEEQACVRFGLYHQMPFLGPWDLDLLQIIVL